MKKIPIILFLCFMFNTATAAKVTEYRPFFARVNANEITLRQIDYSNNTTRYLVLNTHDFSTRITHHLPISAIASMSCSQQRHSISKEPCVFFCAQFCTPSVVA